MLHTCTHLEEYPHTRDHTQYEEQTPPDVGAVQDQFRGSLEHTQYLSKQDSKERPYGSIDNGP